MTRKQGPPVKAFVDAMDKLGVRDWEHPLHYYDYQTAWEEGASPDETGHWPSKYKHELHPNRFIEEDGQWIDTISGEKVSEEDYLINEMKRREFEGNRAFE